MNTTSKLIAASIGLSILVSLTGCSSENLENERLDAHTKVSQAVTHGNELLVYKTLVQDNYDEYEASVLSLNSLLESSENLSDQAFIDESTKSLSSETKARKPYATSIANFIQTEIKAGEDKYGEEYTPDCSPLADNLVEKIMGFGSPEAAIKKVSDCVGEANTNAIANSITGANSYSSSSKDGVHQKNETKNWSDRFGG